MRSCPLLVTTTALPSTLCRWRSMAMWSMALWTRWCVRPPTREYCSTPRCYAVCLRTASSRFRTSICRTPISRLFREVNSSRRSKIATTDMAATRPSSSRAPTNALTASTRASAAITYLPRRRLRVATCLWSSRTTTTMPSVTRSRRCRLLPMAMWCVCAAYAVSRSSTVSGL